MSTNRALKYMKQKTGQLKGETDKPTIMWEMSKLLSQLLVEQVDRKPVQGDKT